MKLGFVILPLAYNAPHLATSTFKAILSKKNIQSEIVYLNAEFCEIIGQTCYSSSIHHGIRLAYNWAFGDTDCENRSAFIEFPVALGVQYFLSENVINSVYLDEIAALRLQNTLYDFLNKNVEKLAEKYSVLAFPVYLYNVYSVLGMARRIKQLYPNHTIILGGPSVFSSMGNEYVTKLDYIDVAFTRECEESFPTFIQRLWQGEDRATALRDITGVAYRMNNSVYIKEPTHLSVDMDNIPIPDYSDWHRQVLPYMKNRPIPLYLSKGCQYGMKQPCSFCAEVGEFSVSKHTSRSNQNAIEYICGAMDRYPDAVRYDICDSMMTTNTIRNVMPHVAKHNKNAKPLFGEVKPWISRTDMRLLYDAGFRELVTGMEAFHPHLVKLLRKGHKVYQSIAFLKWAKLYGIEITWSFLIGVPGQKSEWIAEHEKVVRNIHHLDPPANIQPVNITMFSDYIKNPELWGVKKLTPLQACPSYLDATKISWVWNCSPFVLPEETRICSIVLKWMGQKIRVLSPFSGSLVPHFIPKTSKSSLVFTDNGVCDSRSGTVVNIPLTEKQKEVLVFCEDPVSIEKAVQQFGDVDADILSLIDMNLLYKEEHMLISYVECLNE